MRVLVMGGTQFKGLALVHELVRSGHDVTVCNRGKSEADLPDGVHRLIADRTEHDQLRSVIGAQDWGCVCDISAYHPPDVEIMIDILGGRVGHYVFASSTNIYAQSNLAPITEESPEERGPNQIQYGLHKLMCEDLLLEAHANDRFPATTVPFSMVFGPHNTLRDREQRMFSRILNRRPILVPGDGETMLQIGHVDDQARALEQMMAKPVTFGRRYNLTGTAPVSRNPYVRTLADAVDIEPNIILIPASTMEQLWTGELEVGSGKPVISMDTRTPNATKENPRAALMRRRFQIAQLVQHLAPNIHWWDASATFSIDRIRNEIGWEPQHDFASMTNDTYDWFCRAGRDSDYRWDFEDELLATLEAR